MQTAYAYRYRLEPRGDASSILAQAVGCGRYVWNWALARQMEEYEKTGKKMSYPKLAGELAELKKQDETSFLKDGFSQSHQQTLKHLESAYGKFFKGAGFPRFKKKGRCRESLSLTNQQVSVDRTNGRIKLPKIGWVSFRKDGRKITGRVLNATVSRKNGRWDVAIVVEQELDVAPKTGTSVGIDLGVKRFVSFSDGTFVRPLNSERKSAEKMSMLQAKAARKTRHSNNQKKAYAKISRMSAKIADERKDFLHKLTDSICKNHAVVVVEDLNVSGMSRSAKGTKEKPGRNVSAKRGLNRSIRDQSWGEFLRPLVFSPTKCVLEIPMTTLRVIFLVRSIELFVKNGWLFKDASDSLSFEDTEESRRFTDKIIDGSTLSHYVCGELTFTAPAEQPAEDAQPATDACACGKPVKYPSSGQCTACYCREYRKRKKEESAQPKSSVKTATYTKVETGRFAKVADALMALAEAIREL